MYILCLSKLFLKIIQGYDKSEIKTLGPSCKIIY